MNARKEFNRWFEGHIREAVDAGDATPEDIAEIREAAAHIFEAGYGIGHYDGIESVAEACDKIGRANAGVQPSFMGMAKKLRRENTRPD